MFSCRRPSPRPAERGSTWERTPRRDSPGPLSACVSRDAAAVASPGSYQTAPAHAGDRRTTGRAEPTALLFLPAAAPAGQPAPKVTSRRDRTGAAARALHGVGMVHVEVCTAPNPAQPAAGWIWRSAGNPVDSGVWVTGGNCSARMEWFASN